MCSPYLATTLNLLTMNNEYKRYKKLAGTIIKLKDGYRVYAIGHYWFTTDLALARDYKALYLSEQL